MHVLLWDNGNFAQKIQTITLPTAKREEKLRCFILSTTLLCPEQNWHHEFVVAKGGIRTLSKHLYRVHIVRMDSVHPGITYPNCASEAQVAFNKAAPPQREICYLKGV